MVTRYSTCHFAEVMSDWMQAKHVGAKLEYTTRCSFCGNSCEVVPMYSTLEHDLELTLRRWKDGDCTLDDMFDRVNKQLERSWLRAFDAAAKTLQGGKTAKYRLEPGKMDWQTTPPKEDKDE